MTDLRLIPLGYEQITGLSSTKKLTVPDGANCAVLMAEAKDLRWRDDGTAPTALVGMPLSTTAQPFFYTGALANIEFIEQAASGILNVSYYKIAG